MLTCFKGLLLDLGESYGGKMSRFELFRNNVCILLPLFSALDHSDCDNTCYFIGYYQ